MKDIKYTIDDLCELTGLSRRTVRYYVQEGLIEPPAGRGRGGFYYDSQLKKLFQIKSLQEKGMGLTAIMSYLKEETHEETSYVREIWVKYVISPGIEMHVRRDIEEKDGKNISELIKVAKSFAKERGE